MGVDLTKQHPFLKAVDKAEAIFLWLPLHENGVYIQVNRAALWSAMNVCLIQGCLPDVDFHLSDDLDLHIGGPVAARAEVVEIAPAPQPQPALVAA